MSKITITFPEPNSINFELDVTPDVTAEQLALVAIRLEFLAKYAWNMAQNIRLQDASEQAQNQQKFAVIKPEVWKP